MESPCHRQFRRGIRIHHLLENGGKTLKSWAFHSGELTELRCTKYVKHHHYHHLSSSTIIGKLIINYHIIISIIIKHWNKYGRPKTCISSPRDFQESFRLVVSLGFQVSCGCTSSRQGAKHLNISIHFQEDSFKSSSFGVKWDCARLCGCGMVAPCRRGICSGLRGRRCHQRLMKSQRCHHQKRSRNATAKAPVPQSWSLMKFDEICHDLMSWYEINHVEISSNFIKFPCQKRAKLFYSATWKNSHGSEQLKPWMKKRTTWRFA